MVPMDMGTSPALPAPFSKYNTRIRPISVRISVDFEIPTDIYGYPWILIFKSF